MRRLDWCLITFGFVAMLGAPLLCALPASAKTVTSRDMCLISEPCDQHFLEWRGVPTDPWIMVGPPLPLNPSTTHPQVAGPFRGVVWTGFPDYGEFQAKAMRLREISPASNVLNYGPELPPELLPAPQLLGCSGTERLWWCRRWALV
jgi:hypothetical protein